MRHRWGVIGFVAVISFASGGFLLQRSVQADAASEESLFDDVMSHVNNYYVDSLGNADLYRRATEGMLDYRERNFDGGDRLYNAAAHLFELANQPRVEETLVGL